MLNKICFKLLIANKIKKAEPNFIDPAFIFGAINNSRSYYQNSY